MMPFMPMPMPLAMIPPGVVVSPGPHSAPQQPRISIAHPAAAVSPGPRSAPAAPLKRDWPHTRIADAHKLLEDGMRAIVNDKAKATIVKASPTLLESFKTTNERIKELGRAIWESKQAFKVDLERLLSK